MLLRRACHSEMPRGRMFCMLTGAGLLNANTWLQGSGGPSDKSALQSVLQCIATHIAQGALPCMTGAPCWVCLLRPHMLLGGLRDLAVTGGPG